MEYHIGFGNLFEYSGVQAVQGSVKGRQGRHDAHRLTICGYITIEVLGHRHRSQEKLSAAIFRGGSTSDLSDKIQPAADPSNLWYPGIGSEVFAGEV